MFFGNQTIAQQRILLAKREFKPQRAPFVLFNLLCAWPSSQTINGNQISQVKLQRKTSESIKRVTAQDA